MRLTPRNGLAGAVPVPPGGAVRRSAASAGAGTGGTATRTVRSVTAEVRSGEAAHDPGHPRAKRPILPRARPGVGRDRAPVGRALHAAHAGVRGRQRCLPARHAPDPVYRAGSAVGDRHPDAADRYRRHLHPHRNQPLKGSPAMSTRTTERDLWALSGMTVAATSTAANALTV